MKKLLSRIAIAVAAVLLLASCGVSQTFTSNANLNQTNVVLSQKNFHVVKNVEAVCSATYIFGFGGISKNAIYSNAVAELTKNAKLNYFYGIQISIVKNSAKSILCYTVITYHAEGTVIEFDE